MSNRSEPGPSSDPPAVNSPTPAAGFPREQIELVVRIFPVNFRVELLLSSGLEGSRSHSGFLFVFGVKYRSRYDLFSSPWKARSKGHRCLLCSKTFQSAERLKAHQIVHSEERPHICSDCGASFKVLNSLKLHQRIHTGEKPYGCVECGASFSVSSSLKKHQRLHTGEKPYKCDECGKCFAESSALTVHRRTHTGEKPYQCDCGEAFKLAVSLRRHQRVHAGYQCDACGEIFATALIRANHKRSHKWLDVLQRNWRLRKLQMMSAGHGVVPGQTGPPRDLAVKRDWTES
uniref:C2H2-type domain-containing protein n=1 Tax=Xiphophorus maculatus TaxID=8083 RepID=A0A3B5PUD8_XIPMA